MRWDDIYINGTGRFLPERVAVPQAYDQNAMRLADYVSYTESADLTAPEMAARAAKAALDRSDHTASDIAALVYALFDETDHIAPVCHLQRVLPAPDALAFELGAASDGGSRGLLVAAGLLRADRSARAALVTAAGRFRPPRWGTRELLGLILGDGAAATVLSKESGRARLVCSAHGAVPELETLCTTRTDDRAPDAPRIPIASTGLGPFLGDLRESIVAVVDEVLTDAGTKISEITRLAVTGTGLTQLSAIILEPLGVTAEQTTWSFLREVGHVGPCDPLLGLDHLLREGNLRPGDTVLVIGMGLGFRHTCILLEIESP